jgi:TolA-binding protein
MDAPLSPQRLPYARFGYALAMKELTVRADTAQTTLPPGGTIPEAHSRYATAIDYFRKIIEEYPNSDFAARAAYQIGLIQFEKYFDLDAALASFTSVQQSLPSSSTIQYDIAIKIGEVLTAKGDTANARLWFRRVVAAPTATPDQQDEATYRLAEVEYFCGNFAEAMKTLESISINLTADYANDALGLSAFLQENTMTAPAPLKDFARADFLTRQKKYTEAITIFQALVEKYQQALFVDDALLRIAMLQTQAGRYNDALLTYQQLLHQFKESSIALDRAQFNMAELYDYRLKDKAQALAAYERLLAEYPQSLFIERARKRIRELRGDSL